METNNQKKTRAKISMQTRIVNLTDKVVSLTDKLAAVGRAKNGVEDERDKFARAVEDVNNIAVDKIRKLEDELEMVLSAVENLSEGFAKRGAELETAKKKFDFPDSKRCREIAKDLIWLLTQSLLPYESQPLLNIILISRDSSLYLFKISIGSIISIPYSFSILSLGESVLESYCLIQKLHILHIAL